MHAGTKRHNTTPKGGSSKRTKQVDPNSAEEIVKEMSVGFGLNKYWYDSTPLCCNPIYPNLMREFISNFSIKNGVCSCVVKEVKIEFNTTMLGEWFEVPTVGFDTYYVGSKIVLSSINEKTVLKFSGINKKKVRISHNTLSPLHYFTI